MNHNGIETAISAFVGLMWIILMAIIISVLIGIAFYIFQSIGLYTIAQKRGYDKPWLAWIPYGNDYLTGAIADNINQCNQKKSSYRLILLFTSLGKLVLGGIFIPLATDWFKSGSSFGYSPVFSYGNIEAIGSLGSLLISAIGIGVLVVRCLALHKIYVDYDHKNSMIYLIFTIVFRLHPFFLFAIRNKPSESIYYMQHPEARPQAYYPQQPVPPQGYYPQSNMQAGYYPPQTGAQQPVMQQPIVQQPQQPVYPSQPMAQQPQQPVIQQMEQSADLSQQTVPNSPSDTENLQ